LYAAQSRLGRETATLVTPGVLGTRLGGGARGALARVARLIKVSRLAGTVQPWAATECEQIRILQQRRLECLSGWRGHSEGMSNAPMFKDCFSPPHLTPFQRRWARLTNWFSKVVGRHG
jgi:hypothetical protein